MGANTAKEWFDHQVWVTEWKLYTSLSLEFMIIEGFYFIQIKIWQNLMGSKIEGIQGEKNLDK